MFRLKEFTDICSVSGDEGEIRAFIKSLIAPFADELTVDTMGNVIAFKKGTKPSGKKIIVSAHMDEVGFIVSDITDDGFVKFKSVGGIDPRIMLAQHVVIGKKRVSGVIGIKAVHLQTADERSRVLKESEMYIDIGATGKDEAAKSVKKGDYIAFDSDYTELGGGVVKAKALDDRVGCAIICELMKRYYEESFYFCFCVQEEVGLRGAKVIAQRLGADAALILESTTCSDVAGAEPNEFATTLGGGPALSVMDRASYSDRDFNKFITKTAEENGIPFQFKRTAMGGNDAGSYQTSSRACKTAVISLPCRYIHSPVSCASTEDMRNMCSLSECILENIGKAGF